MDFSFVGTISVHVLCWVLTTRRDKRCRAFRFIVSRLEEGCNRLVVNWPNFPLLAESRTNRSLLLNKIKILTHNNPCDALSCLSELRWGRWRGHKCLVKLFLLCSMFYSSTLAVRSFKNHLECVRYLFTTGTALGPPKCSSFLAKSGWKTCIRVMNTSKTVVTTGFTFDRCTGENPATLLFLEEIFVGCCDGLHWRENAVRSHTERPRWSFNFQATFSLIAPIDSKVTSGP